MSRRGWACEARIGGRPRRARREGYGCRNSGMIPSEHEQQPKHSHGSAAGCTREWSSSTSAATIRPTRAWRNGRRYGLKIRWAARPVRVRFPPPGLCTGVGRSVSEDQPSGGAEHTKGARESTRAKHEKGQARKRRDRGNEKGDEFRRYPRKRPWRYKGPWPPKSGAKKRR